MKNNKKRLVPKRFDWEDYVYTMIGIIFSAMAMGIITYEAANIAVSRTLAMEMLPFSHSKVYNLRLVDSQLPD